MGSYDQLPTDNVFYARGVLFFFKRVARQGKLFLFLVYRYGVTVLRYLGNAPFQIVDRNTLDTCSRGLSYY